MNLRRTTACLVTAAAVAVTGVALSRPAAAAPPSVGGATQVAVVVTDAAHGGR